MFIEQVHVYVSDLSKKIRIRKLRNQKEILTPKTEVEKTKLKTGTYTKKTYHKPSEQLLVQ